MGLVITTSVDYGSDVSTFAGPLLDLDPTFTVITGPRVVAERVARRLTTPRGGLFYDANYGMDIRDFLNAGVTNQLSAIQELCNQEALKEETVQASNCTVTYVAATSTMTIAYRLQLASGPFQFTLSVSQLTASVFLPR